MKLIEKHRQEVGLIPLNFAHFYLLIYLTDILIGAEDELNASTAWSPHNFLHCSYYTDVWDVLWCLKEILRMAKKLECVEWFTVKTISSKISAYWFDRCCNLHVKLWYLIKDLLGQSDSHIAQHAFWSRIRNVLESILKHQGLVMSCLIYLSDKLIVNCMHKFLLCHIRKTHSVVHNSQSSAWCPLLVM